MKSSLSILFFVIFFLISSLFSNEVQTLIDFLKNNKTHFLVLFEPFDGKTPYGLKSSDSFLRDLQFVEKSPEEPSFELERDSLREIFLQKENLSLQVYSYLEIPEREKIRIVPKQKKFFPFGLPVRIFIWVYSQNYKGNLKLILNHPRHGRKIVMIGELNFYGWKRLEAKIPIFGTVSRLNLTRKEFFELEEIFLDFQKSQKSGTILVYLDRLLVLMENKELPYPGIEIEDGWKLK